jgi:GST-like protein
MRSKKKLFVEDWFKKLNPNSKIPVLVDRQPTGDDKQPLTLFESGAILIYLADKTGKFLAPVGTRQRYETIEWLMWQMSGVGPMFGQAGHFYRAAKEQIDYAKKRYLDESKRLLKVLDTQLATTGSFVSGNDYTIADMAIFPWVQSFTKSFKDQFDEGSYFNIEKWLQVIGDRPQVQKGLKVCARDP